MNTQFSQAAGRHVPLGKLAGLLLTSATAVIVATPAHAKGVRAGSIVTNTATATYEVGTTTTTINSNTVSMRVDEVLDVAVASRDANDAGVAADAKGQVRTFTVTNAGNGPEAFNLSALAVNGDAFNPSVTTIAIDTNGDGIYEPGTDLVVASGNAGPSLEPDASYTVLVISDIPATAADASRGEVRLTAVAATGSGDPGTVFAGKGVNGGDAVVGATRAVADAKGGFIVAKATVALTKSATVVDPFGGSRGVPGAAITYHLVAAVSGTASIASLHIADTIPDGTTYQPGSLALDGTALTDAADSDAGTASSSGIAVTLGTQAPGSSHTVIFTVKIN
jgi:uncharacterized repeat protein (TIGR01451 family)